MKSMRIYLLFAALLTSAIMINANPFTFAQSTSNSTGNNATSATSNSTANNGGGSSQGNVHLDAAAKALQSGDKNGALMHMNEADKTLTGAAKMHLDAAISALQSGDTNGAMMHLQESQKNIQ